MSGHDEVVAILGLSALKRSMCEQSRTRKGAVEAA